MEIMSFPETLPRPAQGISIISYGDEFRAPFPRRFSFDAALPVGESAQIDVMDGAFFLIPSAKTVYISSLSAGPQKEPSSGAGLPHRPGEELTNPPPPPT